MIFISYRHSDALLVRALQTALEARVGPEAILRDVKSLPTETDLRDFITELVSEATTVLVVIGPDWFDLSSPRNRPDVRHGRDWVRLEVSLALAWRKRIIPVLLEDASMPTPSSLPSDMVGISDKVGVRLRDSDWEADLDRLQGLLGDFPEPELPASSQLPTLNDVGPVAGRDVVIKGQNVAGRDNFF